MTGLLQLDADRWQLAPARAAAGRTAGGRISVPRWRPSDAMNVAVAADTPLACALPPLRRSRCRLDARAGRRLRATAATVAPPHRRGSRRRRSTTTTACAATPAGRVDADPADFARGIATTCCAEHSRAMPGGREITVLTDDDALRRLRLADRSRAATRSGRARRGRQRRHRPHAPCAGTRSSTTLSRADVAAGRARLSPVAGDRRCARAGARNANVGAG